MWTFFERLGNRGVILGNWKLVSYKEQPWELYDLKTDRGETMNLADESPGIKAELEQLYFNLGRSYQCAAKSSGKRSNTL
ncbi:MAG: hypothetical protein ACLFUC_07910 [Bacteroidales bacterium]